MKPLNLDNRPCSPTSSNCVIWSGRNIPCINLCTGDTVTDVIEKLATELCAIIDQLNISNYDLSCFNITSCPPSSFAELIQFLIEQICASQGISTTGKDLSSGCPDCVVTMADCFITGPQTTMQLVDYVKLIASRICSIGETIIAMQTQITNIDNRVTVLENAVPPTYVLPSIETNCLAPYMSGAVSATIDLVLDTLLNDPTIGYCSLINATGLPTDLLSAVAGACITATTPTLSHPPIPFGTLYLGTWINSPTTVADTINNIWITICDIYNGVPTTVVAAGDGIDVTSVTVGNTTTYTVESTYLETFVASTFINNTRQPINGSITKVTPASVTGVTDGQTMYKFNSVAVNNNIVTAAATPGAWVPNSSIPTCSFGSFDNDASGVFSISVAGTYLINAAIQLKPDNGSTVFWQTTAQGSGTIGVGILSSGLDVYTGNYETLVEDLHRQISLSASVTAYLNVGNVISMSVLNISDRDYNGNTYTSGDVVRFAITKLK